MSVTIENLINNKHVYFIYKINSLLNSDQDQYLIVTNKKFKLDKKTFPFVFSTEEWFEKVLSQNMIPIMCAYLNRKYILKEHVKLYVKPEYKKLQKEASVINIQKSKNKYFDLLQLLCMRQLLEFNKITNFNEIKNYDYTKDDVFQTIYKQLFK